MTCVLGASLRLYVRRSQAKFLKDPNNVGCVWHLARVKFGVQYLTIDDDFKGTRDNVSIHQIWNHKEQQNAKLETVSFDRVVPQWHLPESQKTRPNSISKDDQCHC